ncbi:MAG: cyclic pyranopterin monophosphate synthase MoaC [Gammaproteobacteria bacterium]|jgi:cyclic pyranopterin phosphate synthase|tara:strand:- start:663 stop:1148 length:486 start_codon:yes stop_codon:yes gene_type:complete
MSKLTHLDSKGNAKMVDVTEKQSTHRVATASGRVRMNSETLKLIAEGGHKKGDVIAIARIAGIQAAKSCSQLIPLCHPLMLTSINMALDLDMQQNSVLINATCKVNGQTGVEMEALTAVSVAALTIYDMCKAVDKNMVIEGICLDEKLGGKSGHYQRSESA